MFLKNSSPMLRLKYESMKNHITVSRVILVTFSLALALFLVYLNQEVTLVQQIFIAAGIVLIPLFAVVYLIKPHVIINLFVFLTPMLIGQDIIGGLNAGEMASLFIMLLGFLTLLNSREKLSKAYGQLNSLVWPLIGLAFVGLVSAFFNSASSLPKIISSFFKPIAFAVVALLVFAHNDTPDRLSAFLKLWLLGGFIVAIFSIITYVVGWSWNRLLYFDYSRAAGPFAHYNQLGGFLLLISLPTLAYSFIAEHRLIRIGLVIAFLIELSALFLTYTLGSIFSFVIGIILTVFLVRFGIRFAARTALLFMGIFVIAALSTPFLIKRMSFIDVRLEDRLATISAGFSIARDHFWFGVGSFEDIEEMVSLSEYKYTPFGQNAAVPHNSIVTTWTQHGIFAVVLFLFLLINLLRFLWRYRDEIGRSRYRVFYMGTIMGVLSFLLQNMSNNLILHARIGIFFFAFLAILPRLTQFAHRDKDRDAGNKTRV